MALVGIGLALAALIMSAAASPASAVKDGTEVTTASRWAAYVTTVSKFLFWQTRESSCTGTIVADEWVLTAAHCAVVEGRDEQRNEKCR